VENIIQYLGDGKMKKREIRPEDIKANIYDRVELTADISGFTSQNVMELEKDWNELFDRTLYRMEESGLQLHEFMEYQKRNDILYSAAKSDSAAERERVIRYYDKSRSEEICICTKFISIKLDYKTAHSLREKIKLFSAILNCCGKVKFFHIDRLLLTKTNSIICRSLYRMYQCFDKAAFGEIAYGLRQKADEYKLKNSCIFEYLDCMVSVDKEVSQGLYNNAASYRGVLKIEAGSDAESDCAGMTEEMLEGRFRHMNDIIFEVFLCHVTDRFALDLVEGSTDKVIGGFHRNERI